MSELIPASLRDELKIAKLVQQGELSYVIKEPDKQAYYHFSDAQYAFLALFDGCLTVSELVNEFNRQSELYEFGVEDALELHDCCLKFGLLTRNKAEQNVALLEKIRDQRAKKLLQGQGSLLSLRFQLVDPNDWFNSIIDKMRFIWHPNAIKVQAIFVLFALLAVLFQGERFVNDFNRVYIQAQHGGFGYLSIWLIALFAIAVHECGHGLTCKYYGGDVHEMGFLLLAFQPCLYCNVNDAWLFENKWHKIYVALAGVWVELLLAGLGACVWLLVDVANPIGFIAFVLLTIGSATSLLVNLNPLLKFDGYYILTDFLEIKNLRQNSIAWMSFTLKTKILRLKEEAPLTPSKRERRVYLIYGLLITLYMIFILSFLVLLGYAYISATFGFLANCAFIYLVFILVKKITGTWSATLGKWFRLVLWQTAKRKKISSLLGIVAIALLIFWQSPIAVNSTGVVAAPTHIIYAPKDGAVASIAYNAQRTITSATNESFISLTSRDLTLKAEQLSNDQEMLMMQLQQAASLSQINIVNQLRIEKLLLDAKRMALTKQLASLEIPLPHGDWVVDGMPQESVLGRYYRAGDPIVTLVSPRIRFIDVIVDQRDVGLLAIGDQARVKLAGVGPRIFKAQIKMISPLAKLAGIEQSLVIRMLISEQGKGLIPPLGISAQVTILGQKQALWRHFMHIIRKTLRADLWL